MTPLAKVDIGNSVQQALNQFFGFLPNLLGALLILLIGFFIAKAVMKVIEKLLQGAGLDRSLHSGQTGQYVEKISPGASPSRLIGRVAYYFIFLGALSLAVSALGVPALTNFISSIFAYLPNVIVAILIFVLAGAISAAVAGLVAKTMGDTPTGKLVATIVPVLIMGIAIFMILNQLKIAPEIVTITYAVLMGALGLGLALAFGLGGREVAADLLSSAYDKGQEKKGQVKGDLQTGRERGREQAQQAKERAQEKTQQMGDSGGAGVPQARPGQ